MYNYSNLNCLEPAKILNITCYSLNWKEPMLQLVETYEGQFFFSSFFATRGKIKRKDYIYLLCDDDEGMGCLFFLIVFPLKYVKATCGEYIWRTSLWSNAKGKFNHLRLDRRSDAIKSVPPVLFSLAALNSTPFSFSLSFLLVLRSYTSLSLSLSIRPFCSGNLTQHLLTKSFSNLLLTAYA